jgi:hypothetical protein
MDATTQKGSRSPRPDQLPLEVCMIGGDKHSGDDDKQTDHLDKGSDGHTVESGDDK